MVARPAQRALGVPGRSRGAQLYPGCAPAQRISLRGSSPGPPQTRVLSIWSVRDPTSHIHLGEFTCNVGALAVAAGLAFGGIVAGVKAFNSPRGILNGVPFLMHFFLATVMILAAAGDVRIMRFGVPRGGPRLARHLWRMCFALFIAAGSFFSIRERVARILPEPFTTAPMRALPILLLFGAMCYWLWRVRGRRPLSVLVRHDSVPLVTRAK